MPSLTLDQQVMAKVTGAHHYEERMLCLLLLLRLPRTRVIYVTSTPVSETSSITTSTCFRASRACMPAGG